MNHEELAFVNQQLAGMLKCGLPLEGSLKQLCATMQRGKLRTELAALEADLAKGVPLKDALAARQLPAFYQHMLTVGAQSNDLPGVLILLADYYTRIHALRMRLSALMVYPAIVFVASTALSFGLALVFQPMLTGLLEEMIGEPQRPLIGVGLWFVPVLFAVLLSAFTLAFIIPAVREFLRWKLPGVREAGLAQLAAGLHLLVKGGVPLPQAIELVRQFEVKSAANADLSAWKQRIEQGQGTTAGLGADFRAIPPLFVWLVQGGGEDLATGLRRAADIYGQRADRKIAMLLYAALPVAVMGLGFLIVNQFVPFFLELVRLMDMLSGGS